MTKKVLFVNILLIIFTGYWCYGQTTGLSEKNMFPQNERPGLSSRLGWYDPIVNIPSDFSKFFYIDTHKDVPAILDLSLISASLLNFDRQTWEETRENYNSSPFFHNLSNFSVAMGDGKYHFMLAGVFALYGLISKNRVAVKTACNIIEALLATGLFVQTFKRITGRASPAFTTSDYAKWSILPNLDNYQDVQPKYYSFPSGHLASAFTTLTVIANNYPQFKWIKPVGYSLMLLLGTGLVSKGMHWYSDLPIGAFIGYSFANIVSPPQVNEDFSSILKAGEKIYVFPTYGVRNIGFDVAFLF